MTGSSAKGMATPSADADRVSTCRRSVSADRRARPGQVPVGEVREEQHDEAVAVHAPDHARHLQGTALGRHHVELHRGARLELGPRPQLGTVGAQVDGVMADPVRAGLDPDRPGDPGTGLTTTRSMVLRSVHGPGGGASAGPPPWRYESERYGRARAPRPPNFVTRLPGRETARAAGSGLPRRQR